VILTRSSPRKKKQIVIYFDQFRVLHYLVQKERNIKKCKTLNGSQSRFQSKGSKEIQKWCLNQKKKDGKKKEKETKFSMDFSIPSLDELMFDLDFNHQEEAFDAFIDHSNQTLDVFGFAELHNVGQTQAALHLINNARQSIAKYENAILTESSANKSWLTSLHYNHVHLSDGKSSIHDSGLKWIGKLYHYKIDGTISQELLTTILISFVQIIKISKKNIDGFILQFELHDLQTLQIGFLDDNQLMEFNQLISLEFSKCSKTQSIEIPSEKQNQLDLNDDYIKSNYLNSIPKQDNCIVEPTKITQTSLSEATTLLKYLNSNLSSQQITLLTDLKTLNISKINFEYNLELERLQIEFESVWQCQLCCDAVADQMMANCDHKVCKNCRLKLDGGKGLGKCPWDRNDLVFK
jgi:hypothetical protein